jgi:hypothetical protein
MALKALRDTYVLERVSDETEIRRRVMAGSMLLPDWVPETDDDFEDSEPANGVQRHGLHAQFDPKQATVDEMRAEVARRRAEGQDVPLEGHPSKARRADLLKALGG